MTRRQIKKRWKHCRSWYYKLAPIWRRLFGWDGPDQVVVEGANKGAVIARFPRRGAR